MGFTRKKAGVARFFPGNEAHPPYDYSFAKRQILLKK
jgi:hypothetical protein